MSGELLTLDDEKPFAQYLIAGWKRQWPDGGEISGGLPQYLMEKLGARKIGEMGKEEIGRASCRERVYVLV